MSHAKSLPLVGLLLAAICQPAVSSAQTILMEGIDDWHVEFYCGNPNVRGFVQGPKLQTALSGIVAFDSQGNGYVAAGTFIAVVHAASQPDAPVPQFSSVPNHVRILTGQPDVSGNTDGPPGVATFGNAIDIAIAGDGRLFVVDAANMTLRKIEQDKVGVWHTTTVAGMPGRQGRRDGPGNQALFESVFDSVTVDPATGIVYVFAGDYLRKFENGVVTTLNPRGGTGYENGPVATARFAHSQGRAHGLTADGKGNLYVADKVNMAIRKVDLTKGEVSTIAGVLPGQPKDRPRDGLNALEGRFHPGGGPNMIFYSAALDALICRSDDETTIRIIKDGSLKTFGPGPGRSQNWTGPWKSAISGVPCGVDAEGNVYVMGGGCIRKVGRK